MPSGYEKRIHVYFVEVRTNPREFSVTAAFDSGNAVVMHTFMKVDELLERQTKGAIFHECDPLVFNLSNLLRFLNQTMSSTLGYYKKSEDQIKAEREEAKAAADRLKAAKGKKKK